LGQLKGIFTGKKKKDETKFQMSTCSEIRRDGERRAKALLVKVTFPRASKAGAAQTSINPHKCWLETCRHPIIDRQQEEFLKKKEKQHVETAITTRLIILIVGQKTS